MRVQFCTVRVTLSLTNIQAIGHRLWFATSVVVTSWLPAVISLMRSVGYAGRQAILLKYAAQNSVRNEGHLELRFYTLWRRSKLIAQLRMFTQYLP